MLFFNKTSKDILWKHELEDIASKNTKRHFKGCEINKDYFDKIIKLL